MQHWDVIGLNLTKKESSMSKILPCIATVIILTGLATPLATAQVNDVRAVEMAQRTDDIGADGLKRRGDGSIDDSQPGVGDRRISDDIGADGLKRRGDGSIDDSQPGADRVRDRDRSRDRDRDRDRDRSDRKGRG